MKMRPTSYLKLLVPAPGIIVKNSWTANFLRKIEEAQDPGVKKDTECTRTRTSDSKQVRENTKKMWSLKIY